MRVTAHLFLCPPSNLVAKFTCITLDPSAITISRSEPLILFVFDKECFFLKFAKMALD